MVSRSAAAVLPLVCCLLAVPAPARAESGTGVTVSTCPPSGLLTLGWADACGGDVLDALFTGLVEYDPRTSRATYAMARSISTKDNRRFTVRLREGWTFHDGTEVKAHNFVDAWNQTAAAGKSGTAFLFEDIKGYGSRVMSGLKVVDDHTFTIELKRPFGPFTQKLGHVAFSPLPDSLLKSPASFQREPVGNGPFRVVRWAPGTETVLERYDGYAGRAKAQVDKITYRVYRNDLTAYGELLNGRLDFLSYVPPVKLDRFAEDLDGRVINRPGGVIQEIGIPLRLGTNADLRKAVSMAIDRKAITRKLYNGGRSPAESFVPPTAEGAKPGACGTFCRYDPARARTYLARAKAKGFRTPASIPLYYNADSTHGDWVKAVAASVNAVFKGEVTIVPKSMETYDEFHRATSKGTVKGMFRMGWQLDFPHIQNVLGPQFASGGVYNYGLYRNPRFDALLRAADRQVPGAKAIGLYRKAEEMLVRDMPAIPLWFYRDASGYSGRIAAPRLTPFGWLDPVSVRPA
ncbi:ABC transporter substrate-binding protein [Microbispora sp. NPDC046933]|uniref:ABC transporter substrate-binding protein n=1 Tax=Microbispora sp. NPDC046933 TaxID=3155618 RepID=UPI0033CBA6AB